MFSLARITRLLWDCPISPVEKKRELGNAAQLCALFELAQSIKSADKREFARNQRMNLPAADCLAVVPVTSEPVSGPKFPLTGKNTGKSQLPLSPKAIKTSILLAFSAFSLGKS